jgi:hypothetical protein
MGQQPGMTQRSCNYSGGPGSPRPKLNIVNTVLELLLGRGEGGRGGGGGEWDTNNNLI